MAFYQFGTSQLIPASLDKVWDFISSPRNLKDITPEYMGFDIKSPNLPEKMYAGMIINYTVKPMLGIPLNWVTEITQVEEGKYFVDEQRVGPYKIWQHQHHLEVVPQGVLMKDIVSYVPPFGPIGAIANRFIIRKKLNQIFEFRRKRIEHRFGQINSQQK